MRTILKKWSASGYNEFRLEWLLRVINAVITGDAYFSALRTVDLTTLQLGLDKTEKRIDKILNQNFFPPWLDHAAV